MAYEVGVQHQEVRAVDIQTMYKMRPEEYREYLEGGLIYVDHHDILRSMAAGYPLATTKAQFAALMSYLRELEPQIGESQL
jgi:hypothetical protein